jgi:hypothetical protein
MSLACICMGVGATLDNSALPHNSQMLSMSLVGMMIASNVIARMVNMWRKR